MNTSLREYSAANSHPNIRVSQDFQKLLDTPKTPDITASYKQQIEEVKAAEKNEPGSPTPSR